ncbi:DUF1501 domain-containing protein [Luteolibacter algae]|uniref:DUF1501 domain-containing protein n=1 Tax=Luteolibacter algae TaxID=454151 RepID=A0ABW5D4S6_9BACT
MKPNLNRRQFLQQTSCAAVGTASLFSTLLSLRLTAGAASGGTFGDYKALVCLFLSGGNDSYNMLVPRNSGAYSAYSSARSSLALPKSDLLPVTSTGQAYQEFGIHPELPYLQTLYNNGNAAFVSNIGTLIEPTSISSYQNKSAKLPTGLFSHADERLHWQTVVPQIRGAGPKGWAGRVADCMAQVNSTGSIAMNLSLSGNNVLQTGKSTVPYMTSPKGVVLLDGYDPTNPGDPSTIAVNSILSQNYKNLYQKTLAEKNRGSIDTAFAFDSAVSPLSTTENFPNTTVGSRLETISKVMKARNTLGMNRQIFFVERGGWDHHSAVLSNQQNLFSEVDAAIEAFWKEMNQLGLQNDVVLFTASDFGRTLTSNGSGSDHAWGGNQFVIGGSRTNGGPLNGGKIYGEYPDLSSGSSLDIGRGRLLPTTSVDAYGTELASWFGVPNSELETVFPNAGNFFNPSTTPHPLGMLA